MAIILACDHSSFHQLFQDWPGAVLELSQRELVSDRLRVGLVNLMPEKRAAERQWFNVMAASVDWIEPQLIRMGSYQPSCEPEIVGSKLYRTSKELVLEDLDAIIITGAPVEHLPFEAVSYWAELSQLLANCLNKGIPVLGVCWAAQALLYKRFGIDKHPLAEKCFGLFEHEVKRPEMGLSPGQRLFLPHSRHSAWSRTALMSCNSLQILIDSEAAGPFALKDECGNYYFSGHGEYEPDTLLLEYRRDLAKGLSCALPKGYSGDGKGGWAREHCWEEPFRELFSSWLRAAVRQECAIRGGGQNEAG